MNVNLDLRRSFLWKFTIANVTHAILGADFLKRFNLVVDLANKCLIDGTTKLSTVGRIHKSFTPSVTTIDTNSRYHQILKEFIDITRPASRKEEIHQVKHHIITCDTGRRTSTKTSSS